MKEWINLCPSLLNLRFLLISIEESFGLVNLWDNVSLALEKYSELDFLVMPLEIS